MNVNLKIKVWLNSAQLQSVKKLVIVDVMFTIVLPFAQKTVAYENYKRTCCTECFGVRCWELHC